jgi:hypothetical protein
VGFFDQLSYSIEYHGFVQCLLGGEVSVYRPRSDAGESGDLIERGVRTLSGKGGAGCLEHPVPIATGVGPQGASLRAVGRRGGGVRWIHRTNLLTDVASGALVPYSVSGVIVPFPAEDDPRPRTGMPVTEQTDQQAIRELIDRRKVVALIDLYINTLDEPCAFDQDWARSLFTEDVRLEHEVALLNGLEEVAAAHRMVMGRWERTLHFSTNHRIEFDGDHAHLTARLMAIHVHPGENPPDALIAANFLDADAVRTSRGWRFERFAPRTVWRAGQSPAPVEVNGQ